MFYRDEDCSPAVETLIGFMFVSIFVIGIKRT